MKKKQISAQEILKIQQNVSNIVKRKIEELNYQLLKVLLINEENAWYLRIYINSDKGIDLNDCETVSKAVDELIDNADPVPFGYYLEVCSPGEFLSAEISSNSDIKVNDEIRIDFIGDYNGKKYMEGKLLEYKEDGIIIESKGKKWNLNKEIIKKINLKDFKEVK